MADKSVKVLLELPPVVARSAKADAAQKGVTLKKWWADAALERLRQKPNPWAADARRMERELDEMLGREANGGE